MADKSENHVWKSYRDHQIEIRRTIAAWRTIHPNLEQLRTLIRKVGLAIRDVAAIEFSQCINKIPEQVEFEYEVNRKAEELPGLAVMLFNRVTAHLELAGYHKDVLQDRVQKFARQVVAPIANEAIIMRLERIATAPPAVSAMTTPAPDMLTPKELGSQVRARRKQTHLKTGAFAKAVSVDKSNLLKWEAGTVVPSKENAGKLGELLNWPELPDLFDTVRPSHATPGKK